MGNNLILRCVMLRAENQNLNHQIDERNRHISTTLHNKHWQFSVLREDKSKLMYKGLTRDETKRIACAIQSGGNIHQRLGLKTDSETDLLYKTLEDLQKKLKEKDKKIESLYQKHLHLIADKSKMENDLRSKVLSLEKQLDAAYETLTEFQAEVEGMMNKSLSSTKNTYEALFLQEKLRCSKLMYENLRLHHQIKRLEDNIRRKSSAPDDEEESFRVKSSIDKCPSEPLMKHF